jgi:hypothetical protein
LVVIAEALGDVVGDPSPHLARVALDPCVGGQRLEQRTKRRRVSGHDGGQVFAFWRTLREAPPVPDTTPRISRDEKLARAMPQPTRRVGSRSTGLDLVPRSAVRVRGSGSSEKRDCQRTFKNCSGTNFSRFFRAGGHDRLPPLERAMTSTTAIYTSTSFWRACAPSLVPPSPPRVDSGSSDPRAAWAGSWTAAAAARAPRGLRRQPRAASALVATSTRTVQPAASKATTSR